MTNEEKKTALTGYLRVMLDAENWREVARISYELRELEITGQTRIPLFKPEVFHEEQKQPEPEPIRVVNSAIPHRAEEVLDVLRLSDEELVEKIFPMPKEAGLNAD